MTDEPDPGPALKVAAAPPVADLAEATDAALVIAIARRSHAALAEVYSRYSAVSQGLARRLCGPDGGDDVVQEVFLRLWHNPERFDPERGALRSFLMTQTHSRAIDMLRATRRRRQRETRGATRRTHALVAVDDEVLSRLVSEEVRVALAILADGERRAIVLAYFGGYTYREVATLLGEPEGTVKSRIRKGLARLGAEMTAAAADAMVQPRPPTGRVA